MSRDDGFLATGITSKVDRKIQAEKSKRKEETQAVQSTVQPIAEPVMQIIKDMKAEVVSVEHIVLSDKSEEEKLEAIRLLKHDYELLTKVENRLQRLLKSERSK